MQHLPELKQHSFSILKMLSTYEQTGQGRKTRSQLLTQIQPNKEYSREDLVNLSGLTYDQVRRQTKNLCIEGVIKSRIGEGGKRIYRLRTKFIEQVSVS